MKSIKEILDDKEYSEKQVRAVLNTINAEEEFERDGDLYCKKCGTRRTTNVFNRKVRCICKCQEEKREQEAEEERRKDRLERVKRLKSASLLGERYKNVSFENSSVQDAKYEAVFNRCKKYTEVADQVLNRGIGIYLYGKSGVGKSHITACMANKLMEGFYTVLYTNFAEISKQIRRTFNNKKGESEQAFIEKLANIDFLFIDDFGTERLKKEEEDNWLQEKVFEVINKRYNNNKPTIYTSNYSMKDMIEKRGLASKTIDRIMETAEPMQLEGKSYRAEKRAKNPALF